MVQGALSMVTQAVNITDTGDPTSFVNWSAAAAAIAGVPNGDFLSFGTNQGQSAPGSPEALAFSLSPSAANLAPGAYYELVQISDSNAQNSPQFITVVLNVVPSSGETPPEPNPAGLVFNGRPGQQLGSQQVTLFLTSPSLVSFTASPSTPPGQTWLHVNPKFQRIELESGDGDGHGDDQRVGSGSVYGDGESDGAGMERAVC